jgi:hypothetical protein
METASLCQVFEKTGARGSLILKISENLDLEVVISWVLKKIKKLKQKVILRKTSFSIQSIILFWAKKGAMNGLKDFGT